MRESDHLQPSSGPLALSTKAVLGPSWVYTTWKNDPGHHEGDVFQPHGQMLDPEVFDVSLD